MDETARTSAYAATSDAARPFPRLEGRKTAEIAIVGGGFTGLSTALHLAQAGKDVCLLEAYQPGWGASGRNGGQLNPGLKYDPSAISALFGEKKGAELIKLAWSSVDFVDELIGRHGIDCGLRRNGTLRVARRERDLGAIRQSQADMQAHGMPVDWLDRPQLAQFTGTSFYQGGFIDRRGGDLNPLRFAQGMADAAAASGAIIHGESRVSKLERNGGSWTISTDRASLTARRILVCCNGYTDALVPRLRRAMVPVFSSVLASNPLPPSLVRTVMPGRQVLYESGLVTTYCRVDDQDRLIIGGRGPMTPINSTNSLKPIKRHAELLWPDIARVGWQTAWNGRVAVTTDHLPHIHEMGDGLLAVYGYNGRGVALSTALGRRLAEALSGTIATGDLPIPLSPLKPIAFHRLWPLGVHATIAWSRLKDRFS